MKKLFALLSCGLVFGLAAEDDLLDQMSKQLNRLEQRYWYAVIMDINESFYKETKELLRETVSTGRQIQTIVSKSDYKGSGNLTVSTTALQKVFEDATRKQDKKLRYSFKETAMSEYTRRFRQLPENKGQKNVYPTLKNVRLDDYELWLDEICIDNLKKVRLGSNKETIRDRTPTRERVGEYFEALKKLRIALVKLRQESGIDFNPPPKVLQ